MTNIDSIKEFSKLTIRQGMENELHQCAKEIINAGYGTMSGVMLIMHFQKLQEICIENLRTQTHSLRLTEQEIIETIKQTVDKVTKIYLDR